MCFHWTLPHSKSSPQVLAAGHPLGRDPQKQYSFASFLNIAALIGVNLAVFNLLPVPALDGCKVIFCIIEWIRKKPVNRNGEAMIHFIGIILLFGFAIMVDLLQLF